MSTRIVDAKGAKATRSAKPRAESRSESCRSESRRSEVRLQKSIEKPKQAVAIPEAQHAAWYQILRASSKVGQRIEQRLLQAQQIPTHWYDVLVTLEKAPEQRMRMSELAENVLTSPS